MNRPEQGVYYWKYEDIHAAILAACKDLGFPFKSEMSSRVGANLEGKGVIFGLHEFKTNRKK